MLWQFGGIFCTGRSVVSIGCLTAFYVVVVPMELIPSKPKYKTKLWLKHKEEVYSEQAPLVLKRHKKQSNDQWRLLGLNCTVLKCVLTYYNHRKCFSTLFKLWNDLKTHELIPSQKGTHLYAEARSSFHKTLS